MKAGQERAQRRRFLKTHLASFNILSEMLGFASEDPGQPASPPGPENPGAQGLPSKEGAWEQCFQSPASARRPAPHPHLPPHYPASSIFGGKTQHVKFIDHLGFP